MGNTQPWDIEASTDADELLPARAVADELTVTVWTVHNMFRDGRLPGHKMPGLRGAYVFKRSDVVALKARLAAERAARLATASTGGDAA